MTTGNGDLSVEVSGRNGMLAGVLIAGNDGYFSADGHPYIDGDFGMRVAGDAYIHAAPEASQKTYGIVGLGFANGPQGQSQPATGSVEGSLVARSFLCGE